MKQGNEILMSAIAYLANTYGWSANFEAINRMRLLRRLKPMTREEQVRLRNSEALQRYVSMNTASPTRSAPRHADHSAPVNLEPIEHTKHPDYKEPARMFHRSAITGKLGLELCCECASRIVHDVIVDRLEPVVIVNTPCSLCDAPTSHYWVTI